jgi:3alpha(or 20beta)-hydroxysteroid dehydrogenase
MGVAAEFEIFTGAVVVVWMGAIARPRSRFGDLDAMVGNAGVYGTQPLAGTSPEEWDRIQRVNQRGTFLGMRAVLPVLEARGGGAIVNVSSAAGMRGFPSMFSYGVSKWAIRCMGRYAAVEAAAAGVRVNTILPGVIVTPMQRSNGPDRIEAMRQSIPMRRIGRPEDVAAAALYLISDEASYVTGVELPVDGGALA